MEMDAQHSKGKSSWRLPLDLLKKVAKEADEQRRTQSVVVEMILTDWFTQKEVKP